MPTHGIYWVKEGKVFSLRVVLEAQHEVFDLHLTRIDHGVVSCRLADGGMQLQREPPRREGVDVAGGQPASMQTLSPGAEEGAEGAPPGDVGAGRAPESPGEPVQDAIAPPPPEIGQAIIASDVAPPRRVRATAKAKQRPRREPGRAGG